MNVPYTTDLNHRKLLHYDFSFPVILGLFGSVFFTGSIRRLSILISLVLNSFGVPICSFLYRFKPVFANHFQETLNIDVFGYK